jgi:UDP-N-acetylglucosamine--N-acetylmuramyl-(pentapeptide) pyrophosphoryl-undecaprenol N-acetylglucosamine transferase
MRQPRVIISGGGTGGHIFPAVAIAQEIKARYPEADILFVGAKGRMEMERVPKAGFPIEGLWISGIQRKLTLKNLIFPLKLISSLWKARQIVSRFKPDAAIGTGGYASGPLLRAAAAKGVPTLIQEQNSFPGITNKWLAPKVNKICVAYDGLERFFPKEKMVFTGNPVRQGLDKQSLAQKEAKERLGFDPDKPLILSLGGSLGARAINEALGAWSKDWLLEGIQIYWQAGKGYYPELSKQWKGAENLLLTEFIDDMPLAYAAADLIISRAGAGTISELCLVGKPVILIPSPNVAEDHQTKNALSLSEKRAAILIREKDLPMALKTEVERWHNQPASFAGYRNEISRLTMPQATAQIVDELEKIWRYEE